MCFANAVLQVLVYCSPFQRLFIELGKLLLSCSPSPSTNGHAHKSQTPFIDATVHFLREFIDDTQLAAAKGKEREVCDQEQENESFLPWYVYDAMKENKRFESMRVRAPTCPTSSQSHTCSPRVANKKTQKSSSGSISTPSRKNCFTSKIH